MRVIDAAFAPALERPFVVIYLALIKVQARQFSLARNCAYTVRAEVLTSQDFICLAAAGPTG